MKTSIKSVIVLTLICLVVSGILAGINFLQVQSSKNMKAE